MKIDNTLQRLQIAKKANLKLKGLENAPITNDRGTFYPKTPSIPSKSRENSLDIKLSHPIPAIPKTYPKKNIDAIVKRNIA